MLTRHSADALRHNKQRTAITAITKPTILKLGRDRFHSVINAISDHRGVCTTIGMSFAFGRSLKEAADMPTDKERREPLTNALPCTASDQDIEKAEAFREALRKLLLNKHEPAVAVYCAVSAD